MDMTDITKISMKKYTNNWRYFRVIFKIQKKYHRIFTGYIYKISFEISKYWVYPWIYTNGYTFYGYIFDKFMKNIIFWIYFIHLFLDIFAVISIFVGYIQKIHIFLKISMKKISFHICYIKSYNDP